MLLDAILFKWLWTLPRVAQGGVKEGGDGWKADGVSACNVRAHAVQRYSGIHLRCGLLTAAFGLGSCSHLEEIVVLLLRRGAAARTRRLSWGTKAARLVTSLALDVGFFHDQRR